MERKEVKSSQIKSIGYDAKENRLEIEFKSGGVYQYDNIPQKLYDEFQSADSVGSFFYRQIKPHKDKYPFKKLS